MIAQVAVLRAMQQLSEVYSVMTIASLSELVPFFGFSEVEQIIVEAVKQGYLQAGHLCLLALRTMWGNFNPFVMHCACRLL